MTADLLTTLLARPWLLGVARKTLSTQRRAATRRRALATKLEAAHHVAEPGDQSSVSRIAEALMRLLETDRKR